MPELPEVETVRRGLVELIKGKTIKTIDIINSPKSFPNADIEVENFLINAKIIDVRRRAKVLIIDLDTKYSLVIHLKMTGQLVFRHHDHEAAQTNDFGGGHPTDSLISKLPDRSTRVIFAFDSKDKLFFNDQRKFGWIKLMPTDTIGDLKFFQKVGPEPLDKNTTANDFIKRIRCHNRARIKPMFLDQSIIAGVGNIYADESLWSAKIHPESLVGDVSDEQLNTLFIELVKILQLSLKQGGSTDKNYVDAQGNRGNYLTFANVFRRQNQPCHRHPDQEIIKIKVGGRGTHICPVCQVK